MFVGRGGIVDMRLEVRGSRFEGRCWRLEVRGQRLEVRIFELRCYRLMLRVLRCRGKRLEACG